MRILPHARDGARAADRLRHQRARPARLRRRDHRRRHHPRRHGDAWTGRRSTPPRHFVHAGYPRDVEALLIVELDGAAGGGRPPDRARVEEIARDLRRDARVRVSDAARTSGCAFWAGRKAAFRAVGRISPDYYCMDGTIPRARAARCAGAHRASCREHYGLRVANVFHAGDGNLHPLILYDANKPGELERAEAFGADILRLCVEVGGVLTGEHGVGVEKRDLMGDDVRRDRSRAAAAR